MIATENNPSTLFLDRDGVINVEREKDYVKTWNEFHFIPGVFDALLILKKYFDRMIIITNQRGVGAGLMSQQDLDAIHASMLAEFEKKQIHIDKIYSATDEDRNSIRRKPHPYMGHCAQQDFPDIIFRKSWMAGNTPSDMAFGKSLGMKTVYIDDKKVISSVSQLANTDYEVDSLLEFAESVEKKVLML